VAMTIVMGVAPAVFLRPMAPAVDRLVERVTRSARLAVEARPALNADPAGVAGVASGSRRRAPGAGN
jgi:hypothetical protein